MSNATVMPPAIAAGNPGPVPYQQGAAALDCLVFVAARHGLHLTVPQLVHDNALPSDDVSIGELVVCAQRAGLKAQALTMEWKGLSHLGQALPAVVRLNTGAHLVLERVETDGPEAGVVLRDPRAGADAQIVVDRARFEHAWSGDVVMIRRDYDRDTEKQPFSLRFLAGLVFGERRMVRDIVISALILGVLALAPIIFWRIVSDSVLPHQAMSTFAVACIIMALVIVFETLFSYLRHFIILLLTTKVDVKLSEYMFDRVLRLPIDYFERNQVGMISRDMNEMWRIRTFLTGQFFGTVLDSLTLLVFLPVMFAYSPVMTAIVLGVGVLIVLWLIVTIPFYRRRSHAVSAAEGARIAFLVQSLFGMRTIKSLALESEQRRLWDVHVARVARLRQAEGTATAVVLSGVRPLERLAVAASFSVGVYLALQSTDAVYMGALFAFLLLSQRVVQPLMQLAQLVNQYEEVGTAIEIVSELLNQPAEEGHGGNGVRLPLQGHVEFSGVRFSYPGANSPALDAVTFEVPIGATIGIVGRSGSGKTTVTRLLQRLHSDYEGLIKIDGVDVREYDIAHLRRNLGVVLQENFLFRGTIRENIAAAKSDATEDEVVRAARLAGAEEFIERLPEGFDTFVFEGSPNLSGGQRQRIAIARALIVDPAILILDEATSALDPDSEAIVNASIRRIASGRTTIVISHRLMSLVNSDAIIVLERGRLIDIGKHEELLERCDVYANLWSQQNRHIDAAAHARPALVRGPTHGA